MPLDKNKSTSSNDDSTATKSSQSSSKTSKKSNTKSRSKSSSTKSNNDAGNATSGRSSLSSTSNTNNNNNSGSTASGINSINSNNALGATTPSTPTTTNCINVFDAALLAAAAGSGSSASAAADISSNSRSHHKSYAGLEPRSIKIIWEQHDQSDLELSTEVCTRIAEDTSYKLWELINNAKTYARHSGGVITYDLVNEVMRDADVPPALGAMDSDWDRIDYDGSFYFCSDKIIELRDEYQKDVTINIPHGPDFTCSWPVVDDKNSELFKKYIPSLIYVTISGDNNEVETVVAEAAFTPVLGACYRVILVKIIQILAFKQDDNISARCWRLLRACASNVHARGIDCREEYFHLAEILICQLLAPYESIKVPPTNPSSNSETKAKTESPQHTTEEHQEQTQEKSLIPEITPTAIKMEIDEIKLEQHLDAKTEFMEQQPQTANNADNLSTHINHNSHEEKIYKLITDDDANNDDGDGEENQSSEDVNMSESPQQHKKQHNISLTQTSPYFATPVEWKFVDDLCATIGQLAAINGYFHSECLFHIKRRLERVFEGRSITTEREYNYISRAVRGLIVLGEYAFRELIPFMYKLTAEDLPEILKHDFALGAVFLRGPDDIFLYEWLEFVCGANRLQPFLIYHAQYFEKLLTMRFLKRKKATFKIMSKPGVRRLEWSTIAAAMCHGDDPNKALKPKPALKEVFPELVLPNLQLNRAGQIRFKFAGCRPIKTKPKPTGPATTTAATPMQNDILIAKRKLFKPLTNERRIVPLSSYYFVRI